MANFSFGSFPGSLGSSLVPVFQMRKSPANWTAKSATTSKPEPLLPRCGHCSEPDSSMRCSRCKIMTYCSREHQAADFPRHKSASAAVARAQKVLDTEEQKLRAHPDDIDTPRNASREAVGKFWGFTGTRPYMQARYTLVDALGGVNTGVREWLPPLLIRLNRDQECYNFIKWWTVNDDLDWTGLNLCMPTGRNMDAFEPCEYMLMSEYSDLAHWVAACLIKTKMLLDLFTLGGRTVGRGQFDVPRQVLRLIGQRRPRSNVIAGRPDIMNRGDDEQQFLSLELQSYTLFTMIHSKNRYFWPMLFNPGNQLESQPDMFGAGSVEEAKIILASAYSTWVETPGAIEYVKNRGSNDYWKLPPGSAPLH